MTMGAGKTFAAATLAYRLLAHADATRILFLVDRNNLERQTLKEFQAYRPPGTGRLSPTFIMCSGSAPPVPTVTPRSSSRRSSASTRSLPARSFPRRTREVSSYESETAGEPISIAYSERMPPETFDIVVVDECHRSIYGRRLHDVASALMDTLDNDRVSAAVERDDPPLTGLKFDKAGNRMRAEALRVLADAPALRKLLVELKTQSEITIDDVSRDAVIGASST